MKPSLIILLTFVLKLNVLACECVSYYTIKETDENSFERSDLVFLAEVVQAGKEYVIFVKEIFKGKIESDTLIGTALNEYGDLLSNCIYYPSQIGVYLVYANHIDESEQNNRIKLSQCAATRSIDFEDYTYAVPAENGKSEIIRWTESWLSYLRTQ